MSDEFFLEPEPASGSLVSFGQTPLGTAQARRFRFTHPGTGPGRITHVRASEEGEREWAIQFDPMEGLAPGRSGVMTIFFFAKLPGVHRNTLSWTLEGTPASEGNRVEKTLQVEGEAVAGLAAAPAET